MGKNNLCNCDNSDDKEVVASGKVSVGRKFSDVIPEEEDPFGDDEFGRDVFDVSHDREDIRKNDDFKGASNVPYVVNVKNMAFNANDSIEAEYSNNNIINRNIVSTDDNNEE